MSMIGSYAGARVALGERRVYFKVLLIAIIVLVAAKLLTIR